MPHAARSDRAIHRWRPVRFADLMGQRQAANASRRRSGASRFRHSRLPVDRAPRREIIEIADGAPGGRLDAPNRRVVDDSTPLEAARRLLGELNGFRDDEPPKGLWM